MALDGTIIVKSQLRAVALLAQVVQSCLLLYDKHYLAFGKVATEARREIYFHILPPSTINSPP